jgi:hypothetical protein
MWFENDRDTSVTHVHENEVLHHPQIPEEYFRNWQNGQGGDAVGTMVFLNGDRCVGGMSRSLGCSHSLHSLHSLTSLV